ncbi:hypothetical protein CMEL01_09024 [Colletotrichum melonis]|uniref:cyclin-dependent kinase n=1 Tax=Colletotrichum melonis TaxID=1209925 RepID=A0AAI9TZZ7_9PEZI|nr:hypothetical protein CMEL01_09024 [Colletotrichum melonis]
MADSDWRTQLLASDRYENIQRIKSVLETASPDAKDTSQSDAFSVENQAYKDSSSRAQYDEICQLVGSANLSRPEAPAPANDQPEDAGVNIGSYKNCVSFASGLTSEVYRCKDRALKVIVETHNIEPHNPQREARILATLKRPCIPLLETFRDQEQRFVLVFPYKPMTLADVIDKGTISLPQIRRLFKDIFTALANIHGQGIIHRDVKPEAILLDGPEGPAYLSDFGTAWHPTMSIVSEPAKSKILDIGTGPYRAPEALFGDKAYGPSVDVWAAGTMLAECCRSPPKSLFESRPAHEDGNQLGLILSIFKTLGTPTRETWPEAASFKTPPFEMYRMFDGQPWTEILPEVNSHARELISSLVRFDSKRATAEQALQHNLFVFTASFESHEPWKPFRTLRRDLGIEEQRPRDLAPGINVRGPARHRHPTTSNSTFPISQDQVSSDTTSLIRASEVEESCQTMAPPGEKRSKDRAPSGPKKVKNRDGPNIGTQNAPDTSVLGDQPEGSRRQEGSKKKNTNAIADMPRRLAGGKKPHHCPSGEHKSDKACRKGRCLIKCSECASNRSTFGGSKCWVCKKAEIRLAQIAARQAGGVANKALLPRQRPTPVTKRGTWLRMGSLRRHYQAAWANRLRKVISAKILEDVPETTYVDTAMDVCSTPSVAEFDIYMGDVNDESDDEPSLSPVDTSLDSNEQLRFNPENVGPVCNEEQRNKRVRDAVEILKLVCEGLHRLI